jgi:hypothetical protein
LSAHLRAARVFDCGALVFSRAYRSGTYRIRYGKFEPLPAGDRQREKRVAKARNPLQ